MKNIIHFIGQTVVLAVSVFVVTGCGEKRPDAMPALLPCSITITQENAPLEGASVFLYSDDPALANWSVGGTTDASGRVAPRTYGKYSGVPAGNYVVVVTKQEQVADGQPKNVGGIEVAPPMLLYNLVDRKFAEKDTSPLKVTVEKKMAPTTFDVGKKIRAKVEKTDLLKI